MVDYSAFHPHIICELTNFNISNDVDFYAYMAKLCFKKDMIDDEDIKKAKGLTFRQLYGGVEEEYRYQAMPSSASPLSAIVLQHAQTSGEHPQMVNCLFSD
jgi:hypothetical protein